jgi:hypothetical protein
MPEKFSFACFLERLGSSGPQPVIDATAALLGYRFGPAIELTLLDYRTNAQVNRPWSPGDQVVCTWPGPTQILFVYFSGSDARRPCISFMGAAATAELTVSMTDMTLISRADEVEDLCMGLHAVCSNFAARALVAAGGEIGFSDGLLTTRQALNDATAPLSLAQWIAYSNERSLTVAPRFVEIRRSPTTILIKAA